MDYDSVVLNQMARSAVVKRNCGVYLGWKIRVADTGTKLVAMYRHNFPWYASKMYEDREVVIDIQHRLGCVEEG